MVLVIAFAVVILWLIWILGDIYDQVMYAPTKKSNKACSTNKTVNVTATQTNKQPTTGAVDYEKYLKLKQQLNQQNKENKTEN